ncbi:TPA: hypothetical protein ACHTJ0_000705 [Pseudomonas aeruginosa]|jgi:hypothetical protein|uniref:Uncharacterized protein n=7 Tax=Pseudomonadota TaxID=1224 RepID=A0A7X5U9I8_9GAMM|nr:MULTISPECIES: hypothetical protein [Pseudomonadota]MBC7216292.1 hypothetical protein [Burkholderiaceae bacterium]PZP57996.1 MAG: hypothetical protein DI604_34035 [Delftia acidovorans]AOV01818.1 hypothetical protein BI380_10830 [Delftia tsuruhatensis]KAB0695878.1 hypothetical protein F6X67_09425 [Pseudomonas aeruginosa]KAB0729571.1 hypothetical protein F7O90_11240 [Pseudomonas aeruginosa]
MTSSISPGQSIAAKAHLYSDRAKGPMSAAMMEQGSASPVSGLHYAGKKHKVIAPDREIVFEFSQDCLDSGRFAP